MTGLDQAAAEALRSQEIEVPPKILRLALDLAGLLVRNSDTGAGAGARRVMDEVLEARTEISREARDCILETVNRPFFRSNIRPDELRAFASFFGREAGEKLSEEQNKELNLSGFASRYGSEESLLLLDALFRVTVADEPFISERGASALVQAAEELGVDELLVSALFQRYDSRYASGDISWTVEGERVTVGRVPGNDIILKDPQVARHHGTFLKEGDHWRVLDARSGRPVVVDGRPVSSAPVTPSTVVHVGPWKLQISGNTLKGYGHRSFTALSIANLNRKIGEVSLLKDLSFTVFSGEVVALVGPSGAGKTTLINAISGIAPADSGEVQLGGQDFHRILQADPSGVGLVPQEDLVHPELLVEESLFYSGRLRYPKDVGEAEIQKQVDRVLEELGIENIRHSRIGDALKRGISGGQRKRVNLGQELLTRSTRVLFMGEPTSGLDPRSSQDIAQQIRQLADDAGRIVFLVTHDLAAGIMSRVDHLMVIVPGGQLAFFGHPQEACRFFRVASPDLIFSRLGDREPEEWAVLYKESQAYRKYVATREHLVGRREDGEAYTNPALERTGAEDESARTSPSSWLQFTTLTRRYCRTKLRDRTGLAVMLAQPPLLALMMYIVFPVPTFRTMFMYSLAMMWFGMSGAVRELITDRAIWKRERKVGIGVTPYVASKAVILCLAVTLQCIAFTALIFWTIHLGADPYNYSLFRLCGVGILTGIAGTCLGMFISAMYSSSEAAVGTLPLILIPQLCFSSVMVPLRHMGVLSKAITWVTLERYAFDATIKTGKYLGQTGIGDGKWETVPINGPLYELGLKSADVTDMGLELPALVLALVVFSVIPLVGTWWAVWRRDR